MKTMKILMILVPLLLLSTAGNMDAYGHHRYHMFHDYSAGYWDWRWWADGYYLYLPPVGTVVTLVPDEAQVVVVDGRRYYSWDDVTFLRIPNGYEVVENPMPLTKPGTNKSYNQATLTKSSNKDTVPDKITVEIMDAKGRFIPIVITRSGTGFVGPQGEFYKKFPKISELKVIYATN